MRLSEVLEGVVHSRIGVPGDPEIYGIAYDSRQVKPGFLFVCISGFKTNGHLYIEDARGKGAAAILVEKEAVDCDLPIALCNDSRAALARMAGNFYQHPSQQLRLIGVTGTNGKTTTTHLIKAILEEAGKKAGILGTLYARVEDKSFDLGHTTPEAPDIDAFLKVCQEQQAGYVVMEVSSHALVLDRVNALDFNVAVFTNLTQDHLDLHETMEAYCNAKLKLFKNLETCPENFSIINGDDEYAQAFLDQAGSTAVSYGIEKEARIMAQDVHVTLKGSDFTVVYPGGTFKIQMKLIGLFSVYNALAAIAFALTEGIAVETIQSALAQVDGVPGRFEQVQCGQDFTVVVDYAHTPDGLENILKTARGILEHRLITVFGCGGDRDRGKRPLMGEIAARYSDFTIVTSDNPRSEEPQDIINDIVPGVQKVKDSRYAIIVDRREAIRHAIHLARPGDLVVIAGKGHETYQLVKGQVLDFDDRLVAAEFLKGKEQA
ncbi:MAG: UDP-N-acetylmuramoyl-L-alanyl-D-glutamate--2,6-diaminopimelate ligase [Syntrophomonas sp.]